MRRLLILLAVLLAASRAGAQTVSQGAPADPSQAWPVAVESLPSLPAGSQVIGHVIVDSSGVVHVVIDSSATIAVTGTFWQVTQPVSAASLPLPSLAATSTKQSDGTQKAQLVDGSGSVAGQTANALDVNIKSGNPTTITATQATGTNLHVVVDSGTVTANAGTNLNTSALALEAGHLATIDAKVPALGQALAAASVPVVLTAAQVATLTPLATVAVTGTVTTTPPTDATTNVTKWNGNAVSLGTGAAGAGGVLRVVQANDSASMIAGQSQTTGNAISIAARSSGPMSNDPSLIVRSIPPRGISSTTTMAMATDSTTTLLASNVARVKFRVCNRSNSVMFVKFGSGATTLASSVNLRTNECYDDISNYTGQVDAIWYPGADVFATVTETVSCTASCT